MIWGVGLTRMRRLVFLRAEWPIEKKIPRKRTAPHLKRTVMGREAVIAVTKGRLDFGTWEQIFYFEFDGKRNKRALIKIIGE